MLMFSKSTGCPFTAEMMSPAHLGRIRNHNVMSKFLIGDFSKVPAGNHYITYWAKKKSSAPGLKRPYPLWKYTKYCSDVFGKETSFSWFVVHWVAPNQHAIQHIHNGRTIYWSKTHRSREHFFHYHKEGKGGPLLTAKRGSSLFGIYHIPGCSCCVTAAGEVGAIPLIITGCGVEVG